MRMLYIITIVTIIQRNTYIATNVVKSIKKIVALRSIAKSVPKSVNWSDIGNIMQADRNQIKFLPQIQID